METIVSELATSLLQDLMGRSNSLVIDKATQLVQFDAANERKKLEEELLFKAHTLLDDLTTGKTCQRLAGDVFKVCYDVEDLVDDLVLSTSSSSVFGRMRTSLKRKRSTKITIQEMQNRLEDIISKLKEEQRQCARKKVPVRKQYLGRREQYLGRREEKEAIISLLLNETISSVSIIGMGGLGKTAIAWYVLYDSRIKEKFLQFKWVPVSAEFNLKKIAESILHQKLECEYVSDRIPDLFEEKYGTSVLIVLDELWDVTQEDWILFRSLFLRTSDCKVLVTTRNPRVALKIGATPYHLPLMRDEDCQALVKERARCLNNLSNRQQDVLEKIAGAIARKSKGLPLAACILGFSLCTRLIEDDWMSLSQGDIYDTTEFKERILPALNLNTADMRSHLKRCLAYCSLFPRNYSFERDNLVQLWVAEGFIPPQETTNLWRFGEKYFDDLCQRSFFQPSQLGEYGILSYKMHDFIHWFAESVASNVCFRLEDINCCRPSVQVRHLSLLCTGAQLDLKEIEKCDGLRTFLLPKRGVRIGQIPYSFFEKLGRLRVLDLSHTDVDVLPESLGRLKLIRYIDLSETLIQLLPESISNLFGLQVLKLRDCIELLELPKNLNILTSLVHLDVATQCLLCMPANIGSLIHLQTLPSFIVGKGEGYRIAELKNMNCLRGKLNLVDLENVKDGAEAREAELCEKPSIRRLELEWNCNFTNGAIALDVFAGLQPHDCVQELKVTHYVGFSFPTWLTSQSCRLVSIHVQDCWVDDVLPSLGQLPHLEILHIEGMHRVKHMSYPDGSDGAFPLLRSLKIKDMMHLTRWHKLPDNCMPKLNDLTVMDCPSLSSMQSLNLINSLQTFEINRCPALEALPQLPPSIQSLIIIESDMVKQRCEHEGPEWYMIKSIPRVEIDYIKIVFP